jgi:uncharacterized protein YkwD
MATFWVKGCRRSRALAGLWLATAAAVYGCSAADPDADGSVGCDPGEVYACHCTNGSTGTQLCKDDATFAPCGGCGVSMDPVTSAPATGGAASSLDPGGGTSGGPATVDPEEPPPGDDPTPETPEPDPVEPPPPPPPPPDDPDVPNTEHCAPVANWDSLWAAWEEEVLVLVNERRAAGADCGSEGTFGPAAPLTMNPALRCAARLHSMDMVINNYFSHTSQDGTTFAQRISAAGYSWRSIGENISQGGSSPSAVVNGWMGSDGHCANIMSPGFVDIGIGYHTDGTRRRWTQKFGRP